MSNMSYCRFRNTLEDFRDCVENMDDPDVNDDEKKARDRMLLLCKQIADDYEDEIEEILEAKKQRMAQRA